MEDKFIFIPQQLATDIPDILASCDAAFLSFAEDDLWKKTIPAKLQSYMACGMPIIAVAEGETARIIYESCCGIVTSDGAESLANLIIDALRQFDMLRDMSMCAFDYSQKQFAKSKLIDYMDNIITTYR